jgi:hypothetical protein
MMNAINTDLLGSVDTAAARAAAFPLPFRPPSELRGKGMHTQFAQRRLKEDRRIWIYLSTLEMPAVNAVADHLGFVGGGVCDMAVRHCVWEVLRYAGDRRMAVPVVQFQCWAATMFRADVLRAISGAMIELRFATEGDYLPVASSMLCATIPDALDCL